jgi:electron transport complex protein RnfB
MLYLQSKAAAAGGRPAAPTRNARSSTMADAKLYEELAQHLDQGIVGSPRSPALLEILQILFPGEEAEVAVGLPMQDSSLPELKQLFSQRADTLEDTLDRMIEHGTVFVSGPSHAERKYRLLPSVVGWAETPFWAGRDTEEARKLSPLWLRYREEAFGAEIARGGVPPVRVIPISQSLRESAEVLPYETLKQKIEEQSFCAVAKCPCRQMKRYVGEGCDHSLENCLHFGDMGRFMVERGMAREITKEETLKILKEANDEGLVHSGDNLREGTIGTICNCCGCCCVFLDTKKKMGLHTISPSSYVARVDRDLCRACGTCEDRCPMGAIAVGDDDVSEVDEALCIGCGVCTPTCPNDAVDLAKRTEARPPPSIPEFVAARFKTA